MVDSARVFAAFPSSEGTGQLASTVGRLLDAQRTAWPDLARGLEALDSIRLRTIVTTRYATLVQFNPIRITSTGAKVDPGSIARRRCFLCLENLPEAQQAILYRDEYLILCNPAPIFRGHFTVSHLEHRPQSIEGAIGTMLSLARDLAPAYQVFYNGPRCGASAPDHLHFQASPFGAIPLGARPFLERHSNGQVSVRDTVVTLLEGTDRSVLFFRSPSHEQARQTLARILETARRVLETREEPLVNILASWAGLTWQVIVVLRSKHRPEAYFLEGQGKLLISPAAVDMGGLIITPREEDFTRLSAELIEGIYREVSLEPEVAARILEGLA